MSLTKTILDCIISQERILAPREGTIHDDHLFIQMQVSMWSCIFKNIAEVAFETAYELQGFSTTK